MCSGCGQPRDRAVNEDIDGWLVAKRYTCHGCKAAADDVEHHGKLGNGQHMVVVDESGGRTLNPKFMPKL